MKQCCKVVSPLCFRMSFPYRHELYKRVDGPSGIEKYVILSTFPERPSTEEINDAFEGKPR
jgi:adenylate kinase